MLLAIDVDYREAGACAAGVAFTDWADARPQRIYRHVVEAVEDYRPGLFYRRELPCILRLLEAHRLAPAVIVIDGYVDLGASRRPGLGRILYDELGGGTAVIGVAKTRFGDTPRAAELLRGGSRRPLYVGSAGIDLETARGNIAAMHGRYRLPDLLRLADRECRKFPGANIVT